MSPHPDPVTLDDILTTEALSWRSSRPPDWQAEARAMRILADRMAKNSETLLPTLVEIALELCDAGSAGVSLLETTPEGEEIFRSNAVAGKLAASVGGSAPRHLSPCGVCLARGSPQLYSHPERYFTALQNADIPLVEGLVLPLIGENRDLGTIWIVSHDRRRQFDREDVRVMAGLADFTATALLLSRRRRRELRAVNDQLQAEVAERHRAEAVLGRSEDRLRMAMESAGLGTWDWNLTDNELSWDVNCKAMFGLPPEVEISIEVFFEGLHPDDRDRLERVVRKSLNPAGDGSYDTEFRAVGIRDGVERWIAAKGQVYFDDAGNGRRFIGTVLDISDRKRADEERERLLERERAARTEAEQANRIKDEFLAILSHELRTPLNPILGWTKLLQTRKFDEAERARALEIIERNVRLQMQLIDDLLDMARILRGKLSLRLTPVHLSSVVEAAIETVRMSAKVKSISLRVRLSDVGQVFGDIARLQQIVWNLLSNAIKFTPDGGRADVHLERIGDRAELTVRDTGKGISPEFLPHIFESFRQENASISRHHGGLGLGLAIVRQLVEAHGGSIAAESNGAGSGTTFTVRLPLLDGTAEDVPEEGKSPAELDLSGVRILAVDDDCDTRELLTTVLSHYGAWVFALAEPAKVPATLKSFRPDVIVSDIGMPKMDGFALLQQIRCLPPEMGGQTPAIALTAYARIEDGRRALASGYQRHLTKPLDLEQLLEAVATLARRE